MFENSSHLPPGQITGHMQAIIAPTNLLKFLPTPQEYILGYSQDDDPKLSPRGRDGNKL